MKFINKKIILVVIILMIGIIFLDISKPKDNIKLENVNLRSDKDNSMFAIMLEQEDGTYKEDNSNVWPTDGVRTYDKDKSGCIDANGHKIENSLSYNIDTNNVSIRTKEASVCYIYFSFPPYMCDDYNTAAECLIKETDVWNSGLEDDGYRYVGETTDNYICFGTNDKNACINNTEKYMYRIIGIFEDSEGNQHLKLIKPDGVNPEFWYKYNSKSEIEWEDSDIFIGINGTTFLTNATYDYMQEQTWLNKIKDWNYIATKTLTYENYKNNGVYGPHYAYTNGEAIYLHEMNKQSKATKKCYYDASTLADCSVGEWKEVTAKISLMYVSDFILSIGEDGLSYVSNSNKTSWLASFISGTVTNTMTSNGVGTNGVYTSYFVGTSSSGIGVASSALPFSVSNIPVFYLDYNIEITSGMGTISDPFMIEI